MVSEFAQNNPRSMMHSFHKRFFFFRPILLYYIMVNLIYHILLCLPHKHYYSYPFWQFLVCFALSTLIKNVRDASPHRNLKPLTEIPSRFSDPHTKKRFPGHLDKKVAGKFKPIPTEIGTGLR